MKPVFEMVKITGTEGKWKYQECAVTVGDSDLNGRCLMCGSAMRFAHTLIYPKELGHVRGTYENYIWVGVDCAAILIDDNPDIPRLAENETKRKEDWRIRYGNTGRCKTTIDDLIERGKL
jgi:hypothetical protein